MTFHPYLLALRDRRHPHYLLENIPNHCYDEEEDDDDVDCVRAAVPNVAAKPENSQNASA
jgi:hypothetical protein